jgi:hypothetical protein
VVAVLNRVADPTTEAYLRVGLADASVPVAGCFGADHSIEAQWLRGRRVGSDGLAHDASALVRDLESIVGEKETVPAA